MIRRRNVTPDRDPSRRPSAHRSLGAPVAGRRDRARPPRRPRRGVKLRTLAKGGYLCHRGDVLDSWTGVISGLLSLGSTTAGGKSATYAGLSPGMWFGEGTLLKNEPRRYEVIALRESRVAMMNRKTFDWLFENSVGFNHYLLRQFNERLGQFIALVEHDRTLDSTARIARNLAWLLNPALTPSGSAHIEITQEELGLLSGVSRQAANRALKTLEEQRLLKLERNGVTISDRGRLAAYGD